MALSQVVQGRNGRIISIGLILFAIAALPALCQTTGTVPACPTGSQTKQWNDAEGHRVTQCKFPGRIEDGMEQCAQWEGSYWSKSVTVPCGSSVSTAIEASTYERQLGCPASQQLYLWNDAAKKLDDRKSCLPIGWEVLCSDCTCPSGSTAAVQGNSDICVGPRRVSKTSSGGAIQHLAHPYFMISNVQVTSGMSRSSVEAALHRAGASSLSCARPHSQVAPNVEECSSRIVAGGVGMKLKFSFAGGKLASDSQIIPVGLAKKAQSWLRGIYGTPSKFQREELDPTGNNDSLTWSLRQGCSDNNGRRGSGLCALIYVMGLCGEGNGCWKEAEIRWEDYNFAHD